MHKDGGYEKLQAAFAAALAADEAPDEANTMFVGDTARVQHRLALYRGNVRANAVGALRAAYPVIESIVGADYFEGLALAYQQAHPSVSGDLHEYGESFADFLHEFPPAQSLPYLPDVAALEWRVHRAHYSAVVPTLGIAQLAALPPERFQDARLSLHPACALTNSTYPLARIWTVNQRNYDGDMEVEFEEGARYWTLVKRPRWRVEVTSIEAADAAFLSAVMADATLGAAVDAACTVQEDFDLGPVLQSIASEGLLTGLAF